ncbi:peptidase M28 family protein [Sphingomonas changbaiensis NBRC 104936]|uniref:Carboxypeptidase Q n=1 Tax=Sphingomonas changbaiensis NBRC 104936 TaxID=1219043 RepID=A0A0E9MMM2_9SPHN|nr:M20/M25/M40 family metallo-hydrolase [Sphingomonas changbaiensis]GAO38763.1 peptidase M28 family protein [Sphingomonas changbaiensis NBRC 104936]
MQKQRLALLALPFLLVAAAPPHDPAKLRDAALKDDTAWTIAEGLTTEIGPRLAGSAQEARARDWAVAKLKSLGFKNVHVETFDIPGWERGEERGAIVTPYPQPLALTALGNSGATPADGVEAPLVAFANVAALQAAPADQIKGKIVYVGNEMRPAQDGSSYGYFGAVRRSAPSIAAQKGAVAIVIRGLGTDSHRVPHTGVTNFEAGVTPIAAAALSNPDADQIERIVAQGKPITLRLLVTPRRTGPRQSGNVIAEVPGTDPGAGIVAIGGHLDSWDLGTGAIDDAAGVAITAAAAKQIMDAGRPRRTIRVIWFGSEEIGGNGGQAYFDRHKAEPHASVSESDFGADRVWRFETKLNAASAPLTGRLEAALAPLGITKGSGTASAGADLGPWVRAGSNGIDLDQDGLRYFDVHHTSDDTLDKIDPDQLAQNVAAWTAMLAIVANAPESLAGGRD